MWRNLSFFYFPTAEDFEAVQETYFSTGVAVKFPNLALKQKPRWHLDSMC